MKLWKEEQLPRAEKERKPTLRRKWENAFVGRHMDNVLKETYVVSVLNLYLETDTRLREERGQSSSPAPDTKAETDGQEP